MKSLKIFLLLAMVMVVTISVSVSSTSTEEEETLDFLDNNEDAEAEHSDAPGSEPSISLRGASRFLMQKSRPGKMTCNKYPRICHVKGSPGPDCCKKKCVNVKTDRLNCGQCGKKCKYHEMCCNGKCVNPFLDNKHCGSCHSKCKKGSYCVYGMCSYA